MWPLSLEEKITGDSLIPGCPQLGANKDFPRCITHVDPGKFDPLGGSTPGPFSRLLEHPMPRAFGERELERQPEVGDPHPVNRQGIPLRRTHQRFTPCSGNLYLRRMIWNNLPLSAASVTNLPLP